jgi:Ca2+-binding EF-hand superfamily protein
MVIPSSKLQEMAVRMRDMASSLEAQVEQPTLEMQIGYKLLDGAISIPQCLKSWDVKGKGEVIKTAMRQNLRNMNFSATAIEVDALFDSWDADKGTLYAARLIRV